MRERDIENYLVSQVRQAGGRAYKWTSPGNNGVPDRIVMLPGGRIAFVELKAPGQKPTPLQQAQHRAITGFGMPVAVVDSKEGAADLIRRMQSEGGLPPWSSQP